MKGKRKNSDLREIELLCKNIIDRLNIYYHVDGKNVIIKDIAYESVDVLLERLKEKL